MRFRMVLISLMLNSVVFGSLEAFAEAYKVEIFAHRGASFDAPENTIASFNLGYAQNADAVEGDYHLTSDGQIVCIHDDTTKRTTGEDMKIAGSTLAQLRTLDAGKWKGPRFAGEKIPTLAEVLAVVPKDKKVLLEIKCGPKILPAFKAVIEASAVKPEQIRVISFNADVIAGVKAAMPAVKAYWLTGFKKDESTGKWKPTIDEVLATLKKTHADGLDCHANLEVLTPSFIKQLRDAKMEFHAWTVDDPAVAKALVELGVDSITTNKPGWLREQLDIQGDGNHK